MNTLSWFVTIIAIVGWVVNIKHRKYAMMIFTVSTVLSIVYFAITKQMPFVFRSLFYLVIDIVTLYRIFKYEN